MFVGLKVGYSNCCASYFNASLGTAECVANGMGQRVTPCAASVTSPDEFAKCMKVEDGSALYWSPRALVVGDSALARAAAQPSGTRVMLPRVFIDSKADDKDVDESVVMLAEVFLSLLQDVEKYATEPCAKVVVALDMLVPRLVDYVELSLQCAFGRICEQRSKKSRVRSSDPSHTTAPVAAPVPQYVCLPSSVASILSLNRSDLVAVTAIRPASSPNPESFVKLIVMVVRVGDTSHECAVVEVLLWAADSAALEASSFSSRDTLTVRAAAGNHTMGGSAIDNEVFNSICGAKHIEEAALTAKVRQRVLKAVTEAKLVVLGSKRSATVDLEVAGEPLQYELSLVELSRASMIVCNAVLETSKRALQAARLPSSAVDAYLLVGGASRLPQLHTEIGKLFPDALKMTSRQPEQEISRGAAIYCAMTDPPSTIALPGAPLRAPVGALTEFAIVLELFGGTCGVVVPPLLSYPATGHKKLSLFCRAAGGGREGASADSPCSGTSEVHIVAMHKDFVHVLCDVGSLDLMAPSVAAPNPTASSSAAGQVVDLFVEVRSDGVVVARAYVECCHYAAFALFGPFPMLCAS